MSMLARIALCLSLLTLAVWGGGMAHAAPTGSGAIACAVRAEGAEIDADVLCQRVAAELDRAVVRVEDARTVRRGGALQVVRGDAEWFVAWLRDGVITAWTRVAQKEARGHELETIVHTSRTLALRARELDGHCIEIGRVLERALGSSDLVYPWQELYPCKGYTSDVVDPWLARR